MYLNIFLYHCIYRGLLNSFLPDVYIYTDHTKGDTSGKSPGYGISLIATSTSGCVYGSQKISGKAIGALNPTVVSNTADTLMVPEDMGKEAAGLLLNEISRGGCIDSTAQSLIFTLMVLCPEDVSRVRIGELSVAGIATLRLLREFFGVIFKLHQDNPRTTALANNDESSQKHKKSRKSGNDEDERENSDPIDSEEDDEEKTTKKKRKRKQKPSASSKNDIIDYDNPPPKSEPEITAPLTSSITGGHSGKTILVSCLGIGYKNYAKKVT